MFNHFQIEFLLKLKLTKLNSLIVQYISSKVGIKDNILDVKNKVFNKFNNLM
jgi:hypothetical protein